MKISELTPDKRNANKGTQRGAFMLEESLRKYGAGRSILIDKHGNVIAGNKTLEQAGQIGLEDVLVVPTDGKTLVAVQRTDLDLEKDADARALAHADNRIGIVDFDLDVSRLLEDINAGIDLNAFWKPEELEELVKGMNIPLPGSQDDAAASGAMEAADKGEIKVMVQPGDLYQLGEHLLLCGDSTNEKNVSFLMDGKKADMIFADPPYGVNYSDDTSGHQRAQTDYSKKKKEYDQKNTLHTDTIEDYGGFTSSWLKAILPLCAEKWMGYVFFADKRIVELFTAIEALKIRRNTVNIWVKDVAPPSFFHYRLKHEPFLYIGPGSNVKPNGTWYGDNETTVWEVPAIQSAASKDDQGNSWFQGGSKNLDMHPTQKPVALVERALLNSTLQGSVIYDPFCGSGTALIACERNGRQCRAIEKEPKYCQVIINRWEALTGKKAGLVSRNEIQ